MTFDYIVPVYNSAPYLVRCLDSISVQKGTFHVLATDDGSWDNSAVILDEYALRQPNMMVIHQKNFGVSVARNRGIVLSSSNYLAFVDSDDWLASNYLEKLDEELLQFPVDILIFSTVSNFVWGIVKRDDRFFYHQEIIDFYKRFWNQIDFNGCWNKVFSRKIVQKNNLFFTEKNSVEEDLVFNMQFLDCANSLSQIMDPLYFYNQRGSGSLTTSYNPERFSGKMISYREEIRLLTKWNATEVIVFQKQQLINFVSVAVNNMLYEACPLTYRGKIAEIKRFFGNEEVLDCVATTVPSSMRTKMMVFFIRHRLYRTCYFVHWMLRGVKRLFSQKK